MSLPRREAILDLLGEQHRALHANEIRTRLGIEERHMSGLLRMLDALVDDGVVVPFPGQRYKLARGAAPFARAREPELYDGILTVNPRGFGFVSAPGLPDDVWVPAESLGGAMHGDTVSFRVVARTRRGIEGSIVSVVERRRSRVAGVLRRRGKSAWLEPDDSRIRGPVVLAREGVQGEDGAAAVAEITRFPERPEENPEGKLVSVLGVPGDPNVEVAKVLVREGIEEEHPPEAVAEAQAFGDEVDPSALAGREDLTSIPLPTIDPEDARDHDDAVWVERDAHGRYRAWIAIADVSHYVRPGTALDDAALARGNSIYLPDRAIPMLPHALSSNLCSLLPRVVRLCLCVVVDLDATGEVISSRIVEGYMRSAAKLTYPGVARALGLSAHPPRSEEAEAMRDGLSVAWDLARILRARRMRRGALDFDLPEARVILDEETGAPVTVQRRAHDPGVKKAYQLIEELMLLANETVARFMTERDVPTVYRVHAPPDEAKLDRFVSLCEELDVRFELEDALDPKRLSSFLRKIASHPKKDVMHMLLLRAMKQAQYDVANIGHFGLASSAYLHFTSPIRRYPDLLVHRALREVLRGGHVDRSEGATERLRLAATTANERERGAMEIEREVVDLYRCLLMRAHVGETFEGTVTALVGGGVFVALDDPFVDVLVRFESLGRDEYELDEEGLRVVGVCSGDRIAIGDRMLVEIEDVAVLRRTIYARRITAKAEEEEPVTTRERRRRTKKTPAEASERPTRGKGKKGERAPASRPTRKQRATDRGKRTKTRR